MYSYEKEKKLSKRKLLVSLSVLLAAGVAFLSYEYMQMGEEKQDTAVFKEEVPVLALPDATQKGRKPFSVDAKTVLEFYDGKAHEVDSITKFEGVYRANQGIDYAYNGEAFAVEAIFGGTVSDVREDELFGKSVEVVSEQMTITYQSLNEVTVKKGDPISQQTQIGTAGENIYHKDLGKHVHIVTEQNGKIIDPKLVYGKTLEELK